MSRKIISPLIYAAVTGITLLIVVVIFFLAGKNATNQSVKPDFTPAIVFDKEITIDHLITKQREVINLPNLITAHEPIQIQLDLSDYSLAGKSIALKVNYMEVICWIGDQEIYHIYPHPNYITKNGSYSLHIIDFPSSITDQQLTIQLKPILSTIDTYKIFPIFLGPRLNIVLTNLLRQNLFEILTILLLFFTFIVSMIFTALNFRKGYREFELFYIGLLCLNTGLYFASQLWIITYVFHDSPLSLYYLEYTSLILLPVPALALLNGRLNRRFDPLFRLGIWLCFSNVIFQYGLTLTNMADFKLLLPFTHAIFVFSIATIILSFVFTDGHRFPAKKSLFISLFPLLFNTVLGIINYWLYGQLLYKGLMIGGLLFFIGIQIVYALNGYEQLKTSNIRNKIYKNLALTDTLTGLNNRNAYSIMLDELENYKLPFWVVLIDMNNLKQVNDLSGHSAGDKLIVGMASLLKQSITNHPGSNVYRIGGDEFIVFLFHTTEAELEKFVIDLYHQAEEYSNHNPAVEIRFSLGYDCHDPRKHQVLSETIAQADQNMYQDKFRNKTKNEPTTFAH